MLQRWWSALRTWMLKLFVQEIVQEELCMVAYDTAIAVPEPSPGSPPPPPVGIPDVPEAPTVDEEVALDIPIEPGGPLIPLQAFANEGIVEDDDEVNAHTPREGLSSRWHLRGLILDRLDEYFVCIRRLRRVDPDAYAFFSRVGFTVAADSFLNPNHEKNQQIAIPPTGFGGCLLPETKADHPGRKVTPSFIYFQQIAHPTGVQPFTGTIYRVSALYDDRIKEDRWRSRMRWLGSCHVGLCNGTIVLLRQHVLERRRIETGHKSGKRRERLELVNRTWGIPDWLAGVPNEHDTTPEAFASGLFRMCVLTHQSSVEKIVIRAEREGVTAAFGIDVHRGKYFFADREIEALTPRGHKKRIFHIVRRHTRHRADGRVAEVREHYRGIRRFTWKDSAIQIVLPDNSQLLTQPLAAEYEDDVTKPAEYLTSRVAAGAIAAKLGE